MNHEFESKLWNLNQLGTEFRSAAEAHAREYYVLFGQRLAAIYVWGSVHRWEAIPGVSDTDLLPFIGDPFRNEDESSFCEAQNKLDHEFPSAKAFVRPRPVAVLTERGRAYQLRLHYDATLIWGEELGADLPLIPPDAAWAKEWIKSPSELIRFGAGLAPNNSDFTLPNEPNQRLRKLARLVVQEGSCVLMARNVFRSLKVADVVPPLSRLYPQWTTFLRKTYHYSLELKPVGADDIRLYLAEAVPWTEWAEAEVSRIAPVK